MEAAVLQFSNPPVLKQVFPTLAATMNATVSNIVPEAFLSTVLSFIMAEMFSSTLKERYR